MECELLSAQQSLARLADEKSTLERDHRTEVESMMAEHKQRAMVWEASVLQLQKELLHVERSALDKEKQLIEERDRNLSAAESWRIKCETASSELEAERIKSMRLVEQLKGAEERTRAHESLIRMRDDTGLHTPLRADQAADQPKKKLRLEEARQQRRVAFAVGLSSCPTTSVQDQLLQLEELQNYGGKAGGA
jgi:hypothetical protein